LRIETAQDSPLLRILLLQLHSGEAEAIALATDLKADIVLIDEQEGRQLASKAGLAVTGVLGVLLRAKRKGDIAAVKPEIDLLRSKARFFVSPLLEAKVLVAAGEQKHPGVEGTRLNTATRLGMIPTPGSVISG